MLFSADMAVASEVPSTFRSSAIRPGPIALMRLGFGELLQRRRLIRYLVQADLKKKGSDTLLGNIWWVIDPLLQMVVYLILVTVIFQRDSRPTRCSCSPRSCPGSGSAPPSRRHRLGRRPWSGSSSRSTSRSSSCRSPRSSPAIVNFVFGLIPLAVLILVLPRRFSSRPRDKAANSSEGSTDVPADPRHRLRPAPVHAAGRDRPRGDQRLLSRHRQPVGPPPPPVRSTSRRGCTRST